MKITDKSIFQLDAEIVAVFLLGKMICRLLPSGEVIKKRITIVEIYKQDDSACHAYKGKTKRNAPLFDAGGTLYVYLCYGLFYLLNIVTGKPNNAQGILICGVDEVVGSGRVSKVLQMDNTLNNQTIFTSNHLWLEEDGFIIGSIKREKRIGISYAKEQDQNKLWRLSIQL